MPSNHDRSAKSRGIALALGNCAGCISFAPSLSSTQPPSQSQTVCLRLTSSNPRLSRSAANHNWSPCGLIARPSNNALKRSNIPLARASRTMSGEIFSQKVGPVGGICSTAAWDSLTT
ncbi:hypothetical protein D3C73_1209930 [compost metagenome]